jgi:hypothetical protein
MRRQAVMHENFFIAKSRDSESATTAFCRRRSVAATSIVERARDVRIKETPAAHVFLVISTIANLTFSRTTRIVAGVRCRVLEPRAPPVGASVRQHFLKRDAVFFDVLVYSGCSASRFPSARSN